MTGKNKDTDAEIKTGAIEAYHSFDHRELMLAFCQGGSGLFLKIAAYIAVGFPLWRVCESGFVNGILSICLLWWVYVISPALIVAGFIVFQIYFWFKWRIWALGMASVPWHICRLTDAQLVVEFGNITRSIGWESVDAKIGDDHIIMRIPSFSTRNSRDVVSLILIDSFFHSPSMFIESQRLVQRLSLGGDSRVQY